ncbi:hypothetical protein D9M71_747030 [compost metagenome]
MLAVDHRFEGVERHVQHFQFCGACLAIKAEAADRQRVGEGCSGKVDVDAAVELGQRQASGRHPLTRVIRAQMQAPPIGRVDHELSNLPCFIAIDPVAHAIGRAAAVADQNADGADDRAVGCIG